MSKLNRGVRGIKIFKNTFYTATGLVSLYAISLLNSDGLYWPSCTLETEEEVREYCKSCGVEYG